MRMRLALSGVVVVFLMAGSAHAGLVIMDAESGVGPTDLVSTILGSGVTVTNVTYNGCPLGDGTFTGGADIVGFDSGVILSSGNAGSAVGPNDNSGKSTTCQGAGDPDLDALVPGTQTLDAAVLEFDFVPTASRIGFDYVFASDEYNEFVGSSFNDVFAFFVNGQNFALLPTTTPLPVTINNVNSQTNALLFIDNTVCAPTCPWDTQADGLTQVLSLTAPVNAGQTNHIKLAIADVSDDIIDSWVFIRSATFSSSSATVDAEPVKTAVKLTCTVDDQAKGAGTCQGAGFALVTPPGSAAAVAPAVIQPPPGLTQVTKLLKHKFRKGRTVLKLKLNRVGRRQLKADHALPVLVVAQIDDRDNRTSALQRLVMLLGKQ